MTITIITTSSEEVGAAALAMKAAIDAGAPSVTMEHNAPGAADVITISFEPFCPVTECSECDAAACTSERQRAGRITKLQEKRGDLEQQLDRVDRELRETVLHG